MPNMKKQEHVDFSVLTNGAVQKVVHVWPPYPLVMRFIPDVHRHDDKM
jgi:hypothetical protein